MQVPLRSQKQNNRGLVGFVIWHRSVPGSLQNTGRNFIDGIFETQRLCPLPSCFLGPDVTKNFRIILGQRRLKRMIGSPQDTHGEPVG